LESVKEVHLSSKRAKSLIILRTSTVPARVRLSLPFLIDLKVWHAGMIEVWRRD
jgi:hypothetical protein